MHICVSNLTIIGSDNHSAPGGSQAVIWSNITVVLIEPSGTDLNEIVIKIYTSIQIKCIWKCRLQYIGHFVSTSMC